MKKPEILAPAGNMEALKTACLYGADALYLGLKTGSNLRAGAVNFTRDELGTAVGLAHESNVKVYLTLNTYPHDDMFDIVAQDIQIANEVGIDAIIVSDIGVLSLVREIAPGMPVHLSTQANTVNTRAINSWASLGVERVILARELSYQELDFMRNNTAVELEMFIHGSVCISISGRCQISNYLSGRDANQGSCSHPCRWEYTLVERTRQGQYMPVIEDDGYTFLYNSKDLCLLPVMSSVMGLGLNGLKIEGRNKTSIYVATTVSVYRQARDAYLNDPDTFTVRPQWIEEVQKISNRGYFTGFFAGKTDKDGLDYDFKGYKKTHHLAAKVIRAGEGKTIFEARNPLVEGMEMELLSLGGDNVGFVIDDAHINGKKATHIRPGDCFEMKTPFEPVPGELVRKPFKEGYKVVFDGE